MDAGIDSLQGWQLLSELQLQNEQPELAAESAGRGLKCLAQRHSRGYLPPPEVAAGIVLARGHSLLALERLDDAQAMFTALTGIPACTNSNTCLHQACFAYLALCCKVSKASLHSVARRNEGPGACAKLLTGMHVTQSSQCRPAPSLA